MSSSQYEATSRGSVHVKGNHSRIRKAPKPRPPLAAAAPTRTNQLAGGRGVGKATAHHIPDRTAKPNIVPQKESIGKGSHFAHRHSCSTIAGHRPSSKKAFETDPIRTSELWSRVMAPQPRTSSIPVTASRGRGRVGKHSSSGRSPRSEASQQETTLTDTSSSACGPGSRDFEEGVLAPRGITISRQEIFSTPFAHFETDVLPPNCGLVAHYQSRPGLQHSTIWLDDTNDFVEAVREEYHVKYLRGRPEAEFAITGHTKLLHAEPMRSRWPTHRHFLPERYLQPVLKPKGDLWSEPPVTYTNVSIRPYAFDIRPDCAYWISLQAFSSRYRHVAKSVVDIYNAEEGMLCPYLTVEFKKDASDPKKAEHQVAAAGSLALYNRWSLHMRRLSRTDEGFDKSRWRTIRHYGLTLSGPDYSIWCLEPIVCNKKGDWQGCRMFVLSCGRCSIDAADVENLIQWLNEIHAWGLSVHGPEVEMDVKVVLKQEPGAPRTSLSREELDRLSRVRLDEMGS